MTTNEHKPEEAQCQATRPVRLTIATADTGRLIRAALWGLKAVYRPGFRYEKCGVTFLGLHPAAGVQASLFLRPDSPQQVALMAAIDALSRSMRGLLLWSSGTREGRHWRSTQLAAGPRA